MAGIRERLTKKHVSISAVILAVGAMLVSINTILDYFYPAFLEPLVNKTVRKAIYRMVDRECLKDRRPNE